MKKYSILTLLVVILFSTVVFAQAKPNQVNNDDLGYVIPEKNGIYNVPGRPELKVRVFVHNEKLNKPGKPIPPLPQEVCGLLDHNSTELVASAGWKLPSSWKYRLNISSVPSTVGANNLPTIANNAYKQWTDAIENKVTITKGSNTIVNRAVLDGQNIITWGSTSGSALAVSYIWYNRYSGMAIEVDTIINKKFTWYWSDSQGYCAYQGVYDAQDILTHELGHTMGLDDMYTEEYANHTMYGYGSKGETKKDTLTTGDIAGVDIIY